MSPTNRRLPPPTPFPANGPLRICGTLAAAAVCSAAIWKWSGGLGEDWAMLGRPPMLVAHFLGFAVIFWAVLELLFSLRLRSQLNSAADKPAESVDELFDVNSVWNQAIVECRNRPEKRDMDLAPAELPVQVFDTIASEWRADIVNRPWGLVVPFFTLLLGLGQGWQGLQLTGPGAYLKGFGHVYWPLIVSSIEAAIGGAALWVSTLHMNGTISVWNLNARRLLWEKLRAERNQAAATNSPHVSQGEGTSGTAGSTQTGGTQRDSQPGKGGQIGREPGSDVDRNGDTGTKNDESKKGHSRGLSFGEESAGLEGMSADDLEAYDE